MSTTTQPDPDQVAAAIEEWRELRSRINRFNSLKAEILREVAKGRICWPVMAGRGQVQVRDQAELLETIDLGSGVPIMDHTEKGHGKGPSLKTESNDAARVFLLMAIDARKRGMTGTEHLPELSQESAREWAAYCWGLLLQAIPNPETHILLEEYGDAKNYKYVRDGIYGQRRENAENLGRREAIRETFFKAIRRLIR